MAALGQWETDWRGSLKATILLGSERFIERMLGLLSGNRREQTGLREKERLSLNSYRDPTVAKNTSRSDFRIRDLMHYADPVSLYIITQPNDKDTNARDCGHF